jgi:membrane protein DedA with SNARE-associated domain
MQPTDYQRNVIRTVVPAVIGALSALAAKRGFKLDAETSAILAPAFTTVYYAAVRWVEVKHPKFSWLLGSLPVPKCDSCK